jgi:hypothetical protein
MGRIRMHSVRRLLTLLAIVATLAMLSATTVLAKDHTATVNGSSKGTSTVEITPARTCSPVPPVHNATDLLCTFVVNGSYTASGIGSGTYHGTTMIDYGQYGSAGSGPGPCTPVTGAITFEKSHGNTLTTTLGAGSKVCDTSPASTVHNTHLVLDITGGTGRFEGATGTILSDGTSTDDATTAGLHHDNAQLSGHVTLNHDDGDDHGDNGDNGGHGHGDDGGDD